MGRLVQREAPALDHRDVPPDEFEAAHYADQKRHRTRR